MSRDIKFRVWRSDTQEMYETATIQEIASSETPMANFDVLELMQYTGLKDKNGVEIYEGDLLRLNDGEVVTVYWADECAMFCTAHKGDDIDTTEEPLWEHLFMPVLEKLTPDVIGNIYETPELLKENK